MKVRRSLPQARSLCKAALVTVGATLALLVASQAIAGTSLSGPITCTIAGSAVGGDGLLFRPYISDVARPRVKLLVKNSDVTCDDSGVTGETGISKITFVLTAKLLNGTCASLTSAPTLGRAIIAIRWSVGNAFGRLVTVRSKAPVVSATFDGGSDALVLVTAPIAKGAFAGETMTVRLGLEAVDQFIANCPMGITAQSFGQSNPSTIDIH